MLQRNTFNVCVGHINFPAQFGHYIDVMLAPKFVSGSPRLLVIEDHLYGRYGHSLSEYAQLLWFTKRIDEIAPDYEFIRIFHYRRFISTHRPQDATPSSNEPWTSIARAQQLGIYERDFARSASSELFNTPLELFRGVAGHYAAGHQLEDYIRFSDFLLDKNVLSPLEVAEFLQQRKLIPSSSMGVFKRENLKFIFGFLEQASAFLDSNLFTDRVGYQRRTAGFLLERLQSYLIFKRIEAGSSPENFGHNIVISEDAQVRYTL